MKTSAGSGIPFWGWIAFAVLVIVLLSIDLLVHRGQRLESRKRVYIWSAIWIGAGLLFGIVIWIYMGGQAAEEYLAAYLIEKSLSLDNLFVFLIIFQNLNIPNEYQHNVLFWGVFGALVFRALFIFLGVTAIEQLDWVTYLFAAILLFAAYHAFREDPAKKKENKAVKWLSRHLPVTHKTYGLRFVVKENGQWQATPLLIALIGLELTDIVFAIDSVPAALSVTRNLFVVYSSNAFAILGLRALYSALIHVISELKYLHFGLAGVLAFAGGKLIIDDWVHIPALVSVGVTSLLIGAAIFASLRARKKMLRGEEPTRRG